MRARTEGREANFGISEARLVLQAKGTVSITEQEVAKALFQPAQFHRHYPVDRLECSRTIAADTQYASA